MKIMKGTLVLLPSSLKRRPSIMCSFDIWGNWGSLKLPTFKMLSHSFPMDKVPKLNKPSYQMHQLHVSLTPEWQVSGFNSLPVQLFQSANHMLFQVPDTLLSWCKKVWLAQALAVHSVPQWSPCVFCVGGGALLLQAVWLTDCCGFPPDRSGVLCLAIYRIPPSPTECMEMIKREI